MPKQPTKLEILNDYRYQLALVPLNKEPENIDERIVKIKKMIEDGERPAINKSKLGLDVTVAKTATSDEPAAADTKAKKTKGVTAKAASADDVKTKRTKSDDPKTSSGARSGRVNSKTSNTEEVEPKGVRLGDICKRMGIDTRAARIKLRTAYKDQKKSGAPDTIGDSWLWKQADVAKVEALLKGGE